MKIKKLNKKLSIRKTTIANLDKLGMSDIKGGARWTTYTEDTYDGLSDCCSPTDGCGGGGTGGATNSCPTGNQICG